MPPLHLLVKPASSLCNMRCSYCFYHDLSLKREQASYGVMSARTQENVLKKAFAHAERNITIAYQGGEPTLAGLDFFRRSVELQKSLNTRNMTVNNAIQTNGLAIDENWARFFSENNFLVGLSLDGSKDAHDRYRLDPAGKGTFSRIMKTAALFDKYKVEYNILTVANAQTARHIGSIYSFFKKSGFRYLQFIPCLDPLGEMPGSSDYSLSNGAYAAFMKRLFDLWHGDIFTENAVSVRTFDNYIGMLMGYPAESCGMSGVCSAQNVVEADGEVYPCDFYVIDKYKLGNLNEVSFEDIERRRREIGFIAESEALPEKCGMCEYRAICGGGCKRMRRAENPGETPINIYCEAYKEFFGYSLDRMRALAERVRKNGRI